MPFFYRKKDKEEYKKQLLDVFLPSREYSSLQDALVGEASLQSKDSKRIIITFGKEIVSFFTKSGNLVGIHNPHSNFHFLSRVYWSELSTYEAQSIQELPSSTIEDYISYKEILSDRASLVKDIYFSSNFNDLIEFSKSFKRDMNVRSEILVGQTDKFIKSLDFMKIPLDSIQSRVSDEESRVQKLKEDINFTKIADNSLRSLVDKSPDFTDSERLVFAAAEKSATLQDIVDNSAGFLLSEVLESFKKLKESQKILVIGEKVVNLSEENEPEENKPEESEIEENETNLLKDLYISFSSISTLESPVLTQKSHDKLNEFQYEPIDEQTLHDKEVFDLNFEKQIKVIFKKSQKSEKITSRALALAQENEKIEEEIYKLLKADQTLEIEEEIYQKDLLREKLLSELLTLLPLTPKIEVGALSETIEQRLDALKRRPCKFLVPEKRTFVSDESRLEDSPIYKILAKELSSDPENVLDSDSYETNESKVFNDSGETLDSFYTFTEVEQEPDSLEKSEELFESLFNADSSEFSDPEQEEIEPKA